MVSSKLYPANIYRMFYSFAPIQTTVQLGKRSGSSAAFRANLQSSIIDAQIAPSDLANLNRQKIK